MWPAEFYRKDGRSVITVDSLDGPNIVRTVLQGNGPRSFYRQFFF